MNFVKQVVNWLEEYTNRASLYKAKTFGTTHAIERLFGDIECRIRRFWNGFIGNYNRKSMYYGLRHSQASGITSKILKVS